MPSLQVIKGPNVGTVYELTANESVLGRYPFCDVVIPSHTISRQHARIVSADNIYFVEDMNSLNGTFLNGERVRRRMPLKDQDRIRLYETLLLFHAGAVPTSDALEAGKPPEGLAQTQAFEASSEADEPRDEETPAAVVSALELRSGACGGEQRQEQLRLVMQMMHNVNPDTDIDELLSHVLEAALEIFPQAERGHILLVEQPGGRLELKASKHRQEGDLANMTMGPVSQGVAKRVIARGEAVLIGGEDDDSVLTGGAHSSMCAPLLGPSRTPLGILNIDAAATEEPFVEGDLNVLISVGMIAGQSIEYAQMFRSTTPGDAEISPPEG